MMTEHIKAIIETIEAMTNWPALFSQEDFMEIHCSGGDLGENFNKIFADAADAAKSRGYNNSLALAFEKEEALDLAAALKSAHANKERANGAGGKGPSPATQ